MKQLYLFPPNYAAINRAFNVRGKGVIFTFGSVIYNPSRIEIPPALYAHEAVHSTRQRPSPESWWTRYIADPEFRLAEEIPAHRAEWRFHGGAGEWRALEQIARRLASPLYGNLVTVDKAMSLIAA